MQVCGLLESQEYVYGHLILSFSFQLLVNYCLPQLLSMASGIVTLKHLPINVFDKHLTHAYTQSFLTLHNSEVK